jgi:hypothetical protein
MRIALSPFDPMIGYNPPPWKGGRVVECAGLEIRCTGLRYRGFESHPFRQYPFIGEIILRSIRLVSLRMHDSHACLAKFCCEATSVPTKPGLPPLGGVIFGDSPAPAA